MVQNQRKWGGIETAHLLGFNGMRKLRRESDMSDRHVIQDDIKSQRALCEVLAYQPGDLQRTSQ